MPARHRGITYLHLLPLVLQAQLASLSSELEASQLQLRTAQAATAEAVTAASASAAVAAQVRCCRAHVLLLQLCIGIKLPCVGASLQCVESRVGGPACCAGLHAFSRQHTAADPAASPAFMPSFSFALPVSTQASAAAELEAAHRKAAQALQAEIEVLRQQRAAGEAAQAALEGEARTDDARCCACFATQWLQAVCMPPRCAEPLFVQSWLTPRHTFRLPPALPRCGSCRQRYVASARKSRPWQPPRSRRRRSTRRRWRACRR